MRKTTKLLLFIVIGLALIFTALYLINFFKVQEFKRMEIETTAEDEDLADFDPIPMTSEEKQALGLDSRMNFEVIAKDIDGNVTGYRIVEGSEPKPLALELMTDQEKIDKSIPTSTKAQVITRDEEGVVQIYKIITSDSDILTEY